jgi:hypothetical protein
MPSMGNPPEADEQIVACEALLAEIHAISAHVGDAAKPSQVDTSRNRSVCAGFVLAILELVIFDSPTGLGRCRTGLRMYGRERKGCE